MSVLVKVSFQTYNQQQLTSRKSTIYQLIASLRHYYFIPEHISNSQLVFRNVYKNVIDGNFTIEDSLPQNSDNTCELFVDVKEESKIQESKIHESQIQENSNEDVEKIAKYLDLIIKKLETNKNEDLIRQKLRKKRNPLLSQRISKIGKIFKQFTQDNQFLRASLKDLINSADNEQMEMRMCEIYQKFMDQLDSSKMKDVRNLVEIIKNLRNTIDSKQNQIQLLKKAEKQKDQQIEDKINKLKRERQNSSDAHSQIAELKQQIDRIQDKINELNLQANQKEQQSAKLKTYLESAKQRELQLLKQLEKQKLALQKKQKNIQRQLERQRVNNKIKTDELNEIIREKELLLIQKDEQIKKIKENSIQKKVISLKDNLSNQVPFPQLNAPKIGRIQDILIDGTLVDNLKKILETEMKKPITSIFQLLSYDRRDHFKYSLKQNFQNSIHQKRSLLFVALSQEEGKFFGAFTEENYDLSLESYFIPDFNGCSFLFSIIEKQLTHFKIQDGQNSIVFDLDALIFGDDDLVIDFERNCCSSKFVEGRSNVYEIAKNSDKQASNYRKLLSDKLASEKPEKGKSLVNLVQYKIFEVMFGDQAKRLALV